MAVNLLPSDVPQDVYRRVVDIVESIRQRDAAKGLKVAQELEGFIQRKVIKQTVMTTVYGVTRYGARQQIARQLEAKGYPEEEIWRAAQYLVGKTFESIGRMFNKSRLIQDWFNSCAFIIASRCKQPVSWVTPLGFPVSQPYTQPNLVSANRLISHTIEMEVPIYNDPLSGLNAPKQKTAFPPNYIHSLDSSHMMLTSLYCQRQGIAFVSVHDCYWTHPNTVGVMNRICREQFVALHSVPLLEDLSRQFSAKFGACEQKHSDSAKATCKGSPKAAATTRAAPAPSHSSVSNYDERLVDDDLQVLLSECGQVDRKSEVSVASFDKTVTPLIGLLNEAGKAAKAESSAIFKQVPETGDLDLNLVLKSAYFFS